MEGPQEEERKLTFIETDEEGKALVYLFASEPPRDLMCSICMDVLKEAVVTPYGHSYCKACITKEIQMSGRCPMTRQPLTVAQLGPNLLARAFVEDLELHCPYGLKLDGDKRWVLDEEGCPDTCRFSLRKAHVKACDYRPVLCPAGGDKCGVMAKHEVEDHLDLECPHHTGRRRRRATSNASLTEAMTLVFIWSLILFGLMQTNLFSNAFRGIARQLGFLLAIPGFLVVLSLLVDCWTSRESEDGF